MSSKSRQDAFYSIFTTHIQMISTAPASHTACLEFYKYILINIFIGVKEFCSVIYIIYWASEGTSLNTAGQRKLWKEQFR